MSGRPKAATPPRKTTTVRLDQGLLALFYDRIPRPVTISEYINQALREKLERDTRRKK